MKILHVVQAPGGVQRYIQMFLKNDKTKEHENIMICSYDYHYNDYKEYVAAFENVDMQREINVTQDIKAILTVRKYIKKYQPDIIYCHSSKAGAIGRIADIGLKNKVVYNPHGWAFNMKCSSKKKTFYRLVEKFLACYTDKIIAISDYEKSSALSNKICGESKIEVIFNGIDTEEYNNLHDFEISRNDLSIPDGAYVFGYVGRLTKQKAPDVFVKVAAQLKKLIPNTFFLMVGDGDEQEEIKQLISDLGLAECFYITGWVDETMQYIKTFNQAMLLSRWEGFGLVLAEYMWAGKPIVATCVDAIPNLIQNNVNGLLVDVDDVDAVVKCAMNIYNDSELANRLAEKGRDIVKEKFDVKRVIRQHDEMFQKLIGQ